MEDKSILINQLLIRKEKPGTHTVTLPDLAGRTALLQRTMPNLRVKDIIEGNLLAAEARKHAELGIKVMHIPSDNLRIGIITDASWGRLEVSELSLPLTRVP